jgi:hypothetical protein
MSFYVGELSVTLVRDGSCGTGHGAARQFKPA